MNDNIIEHEYIPWNRIGMYLGPYDRVIDGASFVMSFVSGVTDALGFSGSSRMIISIIGDYYSMMAYPCQVDKNLLTAICTGFDRNDAYLSEAFRALPGLHHIKPITTFSRNCLLDISTSEEIYRQIFIAGKRLSCTNEKLNNTSQPFWGIAFTLPKEHFLDTKLELPRLKQAMRIWQGWRSSVAGFDKLPFQTKWHKISLHHYTVDISF